MRSRQKDGPDGRHQGIPARGLGAGRASGTEPITRVFAESRTADGAKKMADYGVGLVNRFNK
jgi:phosphomannomutase